jgi:hypothetical protein
MTRRAAIPEWGICHSRMAIFVTGLQQIQDLRHLMNDAFLAYDRTILDLCRKEVRSREVL